MASHSGKTAALFWRNASAEPAAATLLEEHGQGALEQARLERAAAKRARRQKHSVTGSRSRRRRWARSTAMVDPPRQLLLLLYVDKSSVGHPGIPSAARAPLIVVDQRRVVARRRRRGRRDRLQDGGDEK